MHHYAQGKPTRQAHKGIPEDHFEEEQGRKGFFGRVSHLIKSQPSTRWKKIDGPLKPRLFDVVELEHKSQWQRMLYNSEVALYNYWLKPENQNLIGHRNADGDTIYFCHKGTGEILTEYGLLDYSAGTYIVIPKCLTHTFLPSDQSQFFIIEARANSFEEPDRGVTGRNAIYDTNAYGKPDLETMHERLSSMSVHQISVKHSDEHTHFEYEDCIYADVVGWKGDLFPYTLHMDHLMPLMSHRAHLPPSAHTTFVSQGFVVCSFLPRPLEEDEDALKVPFYHQNIDYDEVLFYHNGDFFSRDGLHAGMISFHPAGFPHGPHPKAIKGIKGKTHTNEYAVMVDTRQKLQRDSLMESIEVKEYWQSWMK